MVETIASWIPAIGMLAALVGPIVFFRSARQRRLAAFVPTIVLWALMIPVGATSWGSHEDNPGEGISSGSFGAAFILAGALALVLGVLGLIVAAVVRVAWRRRRHKPPGDLSVT
jgi:hypothetical protein